MTDSSLHPAPIERTSSGIAGLDVITCGGFLRGGTYIVMGPPGAGKTILGNQICFHHVASGGKAIYITLLAESHARMLAHLGTLKFFDPAPIAASLTYVSGYRILEEQGLGGLLDLMRKLIREHRATLLVLDGLVSAEEFAQSDLLFKKFIHELNMLVSLIGCTTFFLTNGTGRPLCPEHTMVDGLIELSDSLIGLRASRELVVRKFRGSDHLRGKHAFEISGAGVTIYPRIEAVLSHPSPVPDEHRTLLGFGVPALDALVGGGLPAGSSTMLLGPSGSGKTTTGLTFLASGAAERQNGLYFGFFESPPRLMAKGDRVGLRFTELCARGAIEIAWQPPVELIADALADHLLRLVRARRVRRLFIDGLGGFHAATLHPERLNRFFAALWNELRALNVATLFSQETRVLFGPGIDVPIEGLSSTSENIVFLRQVEFKSALRHVVSVIKTRETDHCAEIREFKITDQGIMLGESLNHSAEAILTGIVRSSRRPRAKVTGKAQVRKKARRERGRER
jgi:circadian clock protein KaiC